MVGLELVVGERERERLNDELCKQQGQERAAYLLCGTSAVTTDPWDESPIRRLILHEVIPIPETEYLLSTRDQVSWRTASFVRLLRKAEDEGWIFGVAHNHVDRSSFSSQDDRNEPGLLEIALHRNGPGAELLSVLVEPCGRLRARLL